VSWIVYGVLFGRKRAAPPEDPAGEATGSLAAGGAAPVSDAAPIPGSGRLVDFRSLLEKVRVPVTRSEPSQGAMTEAQKTRAVDMIRDGLPISEAARSVYPDFDRLDERSRVALESTLQEMAKTR